MPLSPVSQPLVDPAARARWWRRLAMAEGAPWLHTEVARRMAERLVVIRQAPSHWLDWWGFGAGGAAAVQAVWPQARRQVVEPTPALALRSRQAMQLPWWAWQRRQAAGGAVVLVQDLPGEQPPAQMVWANMVLHLADNPQSQLQQWHRALAPDGFVMFSTYGPDTLRGLRAVYAALGWPAPHPPYVDMHDLGDMMVEGGFADPVMDQETLELTWSGPDALLAELRSLGNNLSWSRPAGWRTPRWRQRLADALVAHCSRDGRLAMGIELVYGHAYKGQPRRAPGEPVVVSLEALHAKRGKT